VPGPSVPLGADYELSKQVKCLVFQNETASLMGYLDHLIFLTMLASIKFPVRRLIIIIIIIIIAFLYFLACNFLLFYRLLPVIGRLIVVILFNK
jgi:hypothetical protein